MAASSPDPNQLTREQVLRALRHLDRTTLAIPASTVYDLVYRGRRYPPRAVAQQATATSASPPPSRLPPRSGSS